jgi:uncharacterized protein with ParB-like and HNH nuclease domain
MNFKTEPINIETIVSKNLEFLIPVYQRPYVWDDIEIKKLLEDLKYNFENNSDKEYFVGNTYVIKTNKENRPSLYEVIDGQQRFTTFWLLSLCFKTLKIDTELTKYLEIEFEKHKDIRFDFDIRKEVYEYLKGLLDGTAERRFLDVNNEFLKNIAKGIETIKNILITEFSKENLFAFGQFIFKNVKFIFNEAPEKTDLNALFVALGTSGIQLQQSDILKARLLDKITEKDKRITYAKIWEACENMNNYFESNVKEIYQYNTSLVQEQDFVFYNSEKFNVSSSNNNQEKNNGLTINKIIELDNVGNNIKNDEIKSTSTCSSIISFNLLLIHTLRIYKQLNNFSDDIISLDSKNLLDIFEHENGVFNTENGEKNSENVKQFFELLWKIRYFFDKHVVKWLKDEDESYDENAKLLLSYINTSKNEDKAYFSRKEKEFSNIQMLQSVLHFNNILNEVWLTPFLYFLLKKYSEIELSDELILQELERIDNILLPGDKKEMSWNLLNGTVEKPSFDSIKNTLNQDSGTHFNHYWFYKLEYLLWKNWENRENPQFKRYRITSKNSIEHVFAQNEEHNKTIEKNILDSFGNLALLSVGQNSSYSNLSVIKKKDDFTNKQTYDSLKLAKIYSFENWYTDEIKQHQEEMILLLQNHYEQI